MSVNDDILIYRPFERIASDLRLSFMRLRLRHCGENVYVGRHCDIRNLRRVSLGSNVFIARGAVIRDVPVVIGECTLIQNNVALACSGGVVIGKNCIIGENVVLGAANASVNRPIRIEDHVVIGPNCTIADGVIIGPNASIPPNSYLEEDVPASPSAKPPPRVRVYRSLLGRHGWPFTALMLAAVVAAVMTSFGLPTWIALLAAALWGRSRALLWIVALGALLIYVVTSPLGYFSGGWGDGVNEAAGNITVFAFLDAMVFEVIQSLALRLRHNRRSAEN